MPPLVSIVIPCYKGEPYLAEAIDSCLNQTYRDIEVIVVDDASPDGCLEIAEQYARMDSRVSVIRCPMNGGVSKAFNAGFKKAGGKYFTRLAQDDIFDADAVKTMADYLESHPRVGLVYCSDQFVDKSGEVIRCRQPPAAMEVLKHGNKVGLCVMWRREVADKVGEFNPVYDSVEDYEYWFRVEKCFEMALCPSPPLMRVRRHEEMGSNFYSVKQEILGAALLAKHTPGIIKAAKVMNKGYFNAAFVCYKQRRFKEGLGYALRAIRHWPFNLRPYKLIGRMALVSVLKVDATQSRTS